MASTFRDVPLPVLPHDAYALVRASGMEIPSFQIQAEDPHNLRVRFHRGFGWSNPIDVDVSMWQSGPQETVVRYQASIMALADPFGFMDKNIDRFHQHVAAHHHAWITQTPVPPPPQDKHTVKVNLIIIGVVFGFFFLILLLVVIAAVAG